MILSDAIFNALLAILGKNFNDQKDPKVEDVYNAAGLDQGDRIIWDRPARAKWEQILRLHGPDILVLIQSIEELGYAGVAAQLRKALEAAPAAAVATVRVLASAHQPLTLHLQCDRAEHWNTLVAATKSPPLSIYLLGGARGLGHKLFLDRIRAEAQALLAHCIDVYPAAVERPAQLEHAVAGLRDILGEEDIGDVLRRRLVDTNVIFLHRPVGLLDQAKAWLPDYVGTVLPGLADLVGKAREAIGGVIAPGAGTLVAVIPIEWKDAGDHFRTLLRELRERAPDAEIVAPVDLHAIQDAHVTELLSRVTKPKDAAKRAQRIMDESTNTAEIFANLEEEIRRVPVGSP